MTTTRALSDLSEQYHGEGVIHTDKGDVKWYFDFGSGDSKMLSWQGADNVSEQPNYDGHFDCIWFGDVDGNWLRQKLCEILEAKGFKVQRD